MSDKKTSHSRISARVKKQRAKKIEQQKKNDASELNVVNNEFIEAVADLTTESYRFLQVFVSCMNKLNKLESGASKRYESRYQFFIKKLTENLQRIDIHVQDFTNKPYETGLPVTAINLDEFENCNELLIEQMVEPVLMRNGKLLRNGTVILKGVKK